MFDFTLCSPYWSEAHEAASCCNQPGLGTAELLDAIVQLKAALCDYISFAKLCVLADSEPGDFCTGVPAC